MYKVDLVLDHAQGLIFHKTEPNQKIIHNQYKGIKRI